MNWLDIELFACNMQELPRSMHIVTYYMNELHMNIWSFCLRLVNMYIYIFGGVNIYPYLGSSCILQVNISISRQFMHIGGEYIYMEFIHIAGKYLYT